MKRFLRITYKILRNKYILTLLIFFFWLLIFDRNNLIDRIKIVRKLNEMERQKEYYETRIEQDSRKLNELKTNRENLEKFAREQYYMKKPDEEIFVIVEE
ncbi:MAG: septum formation initiator family protein [Bacteroidales bacterium]|nr:septum formation initiator family protein [Bacteroidales bacterium]